MLEFFLFMGGFVLGGLIVVGLIYAAVIAAVAKGLHW